MRWQTYANASTQNDFDIPVLDNMQRTFFNILSILSATSFCCSISLTVKCLSMPSSQHSYWKESLAYSPPLSEQSTLIFLPVFFSIFFLLHKQLQDFSFILNSIYSASPKVIINKRYKVVVTSNKWRFGWSPNICVNIVKNPLGATSCGAEFHFGFVSDNAMLTKIQLADFNTFQ